MVRLAVAVVIVIGVVGTRGIGGLFVINRSFRLGRRRTGGLRGSIPLFVVFHAHSVCRCAKRIDQAFASPAPVLGLASPFAPGAGSAVATAAGADSVVGVAEAPSMAFAVCSAS